MRRLAAGALTHSPRRVRGHGVTRCLACAVVALLAVAASGAQALTAAEQKALFGAIEPWLAAP